MAEEAGQLRLEQSNASACIVELAGPNHFAVASGDPSQSHAMHFVAKLAPVRFVVGPIVVMSVNHLSYAHRAGQLIQG